MQTPLENDHVRYSWLVVLAIVALGWLALLAFREKQRGYWLLVILAAWLVLFLHILAARTGLLTFYLLLGAIVIGLPLRDFQKGHAIAIALFIIALPVLAYFLVPSFHNRILFAQYEWAYAWKGNYLPGSNDAMRILSWKAGYSILQSNPTGGAGFGNITAAVESYYAGLTPPVLPADRILPSSEILIYGAGAGWPGILAFLVAVLAPFLQPVRYRGAWRWLCVISLVGLLYDVPLEVQFGVFIYAIVLLCTARYLLVEKT